MQPDATSKNQLTDVKSRANLSGYEQFVTYCALGGLIADDNGKLNKMTQDQFCQAFGVNPATCWRWKKEPNFAMKVRTRREEVVPLARESIAFNQLFMLGMQTQDKRAAVDALKTYLGHFNNLQLPVQRQDIKVQGGLMEVLQAAEADGIIEGEIVDASPIITTTSGEITPALPPTS